MKELFETLCYLLDDEVERQGNILALCKEQGNAARRHDIEYLEAHTAAMGPLMKDALQADVLRGKLLARIAQECGLSETRMSLTHLIGIAEEPWCTKLRDCQEHLQEVLDATRNTVRSNAGVFRRSLHVIAQAMQTLELCTASGAAYTASGVETGTGTPNPSVIDRKG